MKWLFLLALLPLFAKEPAVKLVEIYPFQGYERVLHIGCQDGSLTAGIAQELPDGLVIGIDDTLDVVRLAEETYDLDLFSNLSFLPGDVHALPYREDFDLVVSFHAEKWETGNALDNIYQSLVPGGRLLLTFAPESMSEEELSLLAGQFRAFEVWTTDDGSTHLEAIK